MTPLSSKLRADYVEMVNQQLDKLPLNNIEDFKKVRTILKNFLKTNEISGCDNNEDLRYRISELKGLIDEPEMYATPEN